MELFFFFFCRDWLRKISDIVILYLLTFPCNRCSFMLHWARRGGGSIWLGCHPEASPVGLFWACRRKPRRLRIDYIFQLVRECLGIPRRRTWLENTIPEVLLVRRHWSQDPARMHVYWLWDQVMLGLPPLSKDLFDISCVSYPEYISFSKSFK